METTPSLLASLGFPKRPFAVLSRYSIADLIRPGERCGIYVLHFTDGDYYVGQSKDVTKRFVQHRRSESRGDIEHIYFKALPETSLDSEEADVTARLEAANLKLRNILLVSWNGGEADFDEIMPLIEQERWLADPGLVGDANFKRLVDEELRNKYHRRFQRFLQVPERAMVVDILREYVKSGLPAARRAEVAFWSVSCFPYPRVLARINLFWQMVLSINLAKGGGLRISFWMAKSPFDQLSREECDEYSTRFPSLEGMHHRFDPGGPDQANYSVDGSDVLAFIRDPKVLQAIRLFNLRLMRKGPCNWNRTHCMDLADLVAG